MSANALGDLLQSIREAVDHAKSRTMHLANLVLAAKQAFDDGHRPEEVIPENTGNLWLDWCNHHFRFSVRYCHLLAGCGEYLAANTWFVQHAAQIDLYKVEIIRRIRDPQKAKTFLSRNNLEELSRDELNDRVNLYLGREGKAKEYTASSTAQPARPEQLELVLVDPDAVAMLDPLEELTYANAYLKRWKASASAQKDSGFLISVADEFERQAVELRKLAQGMADHA